MTASTGAISTPERPVRCGIKGNADWSALEPYRQGILRGEPEAFASSVVAAHAPIAMMTGCSACISIHRGHGRKCALMPRGERTWPELCLPSSARDSHPGRAPGHGTVQPGCGGVRAGNWRVAAEALARGAHVAALPSPGMLGRLCLTAYRQRKHGNGWDLIPCQLLGRLPRPGA
jgi:hypothetical protein